MVRLQTTPELTRDAWPDSRCAVAVAEGLPNCGGGRLAPVHVQSHGHESTSLMMFAAVSVTAFRNPVAVLHVQPRLPTFQPRLGLASGRGLRPVAYWLA